MINVEDVNGTTAFVDPVNDPVCTAPGAMAASQRAEQRLADAVRIDRERGSTEFQHRGRDSFREPLSDRAPRGGLEPDLIPVYGLGCHAPLVRRLVRS
jgi:hypothetical protein